MELQAPGGTLPRSSGTAVTHAMVDVLVEDAVGDGTGDGVIVAIDADRDVEGGII